MANTCAVAQGPPDIVWRVQAHSNAVNELVFIPNSGWLATGGRDGFIRYWDVFNGQPRRAYTNAGFDIPYLAVSVEGQHLAASLYNPYDYCYVKLWDNYTGSEKWTQQYSALRMAFSPKGDILAAAFNNAYGGIDYFNITNGFQSFGVSDSIVGPTCGLVFAEQGNRIITCDQGGLRVWDVTNALIKRYINNDFLPGVLVYSQSGTILANIPAIYPGYPGYIELFKYPDLIPLRRLNHPLKIYEGSFTPDSKVMVSCCQDNMIRFWRIEDGMIFRKYDLEAAGVRNLKVSPDGRFFAYGREDGIIVLARMPPWITEVDRTHQQTRLRWSGGYEWYQVQKTTNVSGAVWANLGGPTTNTTAAYPITATNTFFRVLGLTNAPAGAPSAPGPSKAP